MARGLPPQPTRRAELLGRLNGESHWDVAIVGGGATGLGIALDAVTRGYSTVLIEAHDFASGTSSRATKLVHGGVRYLAQGHLSLVREALHERGNLLRNAPHLVSSLPMIMPAYGLWERAFYGVGLTMYDLLAGRASLGKTRWLSRDETLAGFSNVREDRLRGGVQFWDAQFDDARLAVTLARTAAAQGALLLNYCGATGLIHDGEKVSGVIWRDQETGQQGKLSAGCFINATGVWVDQLRRADGAESGVKAEDLVAPSRGTHLVVDKDFAPGSQALLIPKTRDGRVLFVIPWQGKTILGTTDTPTDKLDGEPSATDVEVDFILSEAARYLERPPARKDVKSVWAGLRPLVRPLQASAGNSKTIGREHTILSAPSGMVTVTGGKWTTYRAMADDVLEHCIERGQLERRNKSVTANFKLIGVENAQDTRPITEAPGLHSYGAEQDWVAELPGADKVLSQGMTEAMVRFAVRFEYARTVEDVLARRYRLLFLDASLAREAGPAVAGIVAEETGRAGGLKEFIALTRQYSNREDERQLSPH